MSESTTSPAGITAEDIAQAIAEAVRQDSLGRHPVERHPLALAAMRIATGGRLDAYIAHRTGDADRQCPVHPVNPKNPTTLVVSITGDTALDINARCRSNRCLDREHKPGQHRPHYSYSALQLSSWLAGCEADYRHFAAELEKVIQALTEDEAAGRPHPKLSALPDLKLPAITDEQRNAVTQQRVRAAATGRVKRTDYPERTAEQIDADCQALGWPQLTVPDPLVRVRDDVVGWRVYHLVDAVEHPDHHGDGRGSRYVQCRYEAVTMDGRRLKTFRHYCRGAKGWYTANGGQPCYSDEARPLWNIRRAMANPTVPAVVVSGAANAKSLQLELDRLGIALVVLSHSYGDNSVTDFTPLESHQASVTFMPDCGHDGSRRHFTGAAVALAAAGVDAFIVDDHPDLADSEDGIDLLAGGDAEVKARLKAAAVTHPDPLKAEPGTADDDRVRELHRHLVEAAVRVEPPAGEDGDGDPTAAKAADQSGRGNAPPSLPTVTPRPQLRRRVPGAPDVGNLARVAEPVAIDSVSGQMILYRPATGVEHRVSVSHGEGRHLSKIATLADWKDGMDWQPTYNCPKTGEEKVRKPPALGGEFGNSIIDRYHGALLKAGERYRIPADLRPGCGAAVIPGPGGRGERVVYNLGNGVVVDGRLHRFTADLCLHLAPSDDLRLAHIYEGGRPSDDELAHLRHHLPLLLAELDVLGFRTAGGARSWLAWWCNAAIGGCIDWRVHYALKSEGGQGKGLLKDVAKILLGGLILSPTNITPASIYNSVQSHSLPTLLDEANAKTDDAQKVINQLLREASEEGATRDRASKESGYRRNRRQLVRPSIYRSMNDLADARNIPTRRRVLYELLTAADIPGFSASNEPRILHHARECSGILARHLIASATEFRTRTAAMRVKYHGIAAADPGCIALNSKQLNSASGMAVADALTTGADDDAAARFASVVGGDFGRQIDEVQKQWTRRLLDILGGVVEVDGKRHSVQELIGWATGSEKDADRYIRERGRRGLNLAGMHLPQRSNLLRVETDTAAFRRFCKSNGIENPAGAADDLRQCPGVLDQRHSRRGWAVAIPPEVLDHDDLKGGSPPPDQRQPEAVN